MPHVNSALQTPADFPIPTLIPINGIELEVFEAGQHNRGKPIVLCHGWPEHAFSWRFQIPALVEAGYHVIVPNQRGYGRSSQPTEVTAYDINQLTEDLVCLLDHYGYCSATFVGHDWGANVVWSLCLLHPRRVKNVIALALPYQARGDKPWLEFMDEYFGDEHYFVHFNKYPGMADAILEANTESFINNLFRSDLPNVPPEPGMLLINLAQAPHSSGKPIMSDAELSVFISSFQDSGFTSSINWYRNLDRNWHILADVNPIIQQPALMIYGDQDKIPKFNQLAKFVPNVDEISLDCGHWIQQEKPEETTQVLLQWLNSQN